MGGGTGDSGTGLGGLNPHLPLRHEVTGLGLAMNLQPTETGGTSPQQDIYPSLVSSLFRVFSFQHSIPQPSPQMLAPRTPFHDSSRCHPQVLSPELDALRFILWSALIPHPPRLLLQLLLSQGKGLTPWFPGSLFHSSWLWPPPSCPHAEQA